MPTVNANNAQAGNHAGPIEFLSHTDINPKFISGVWEVLAVEKEKLAELLLAAFDDLIAEECSDDHDAAEAAASLCECLQISFDNLQAASRKQDAIKFNPK